MAAQTLEPALGARLAAACFIAGVGFLTIASAPWAHAIGVVSLFAFMVVAFFAVVPRALVDDEVGESVADGPRR